MKRNKSIISSIESEIPDIEVLNSMDEEDRIEFERWREKIAMRKRQQYLDKSDYELYQGSDGLWYVYLPDPVKGRKRIKRKNRKDLEDAIVAFYREREENPSILDLFPKWNDERLKNREIQKNSYSKYKCDFLRFFPADNAFCRKPISQITERDLVTFIKGTIIENNLTRKSYNGMKIIIMGLFKYAKTLGYTKLSISTFFADLSLPNNMFQRTRKKDSDNVFTENEEKLLVEYLGDNPTVYNLGLLLMFQTGMRVGEMCVLRPENIQEDGILVNSTEIYYKDPKTSKNVFEIKDSPKMGAEDRLIAVPSQTKAVLMRLRMMNPNGEFLFMRNGKRINSIRFNYHLYKACEAVGIPRRSTHKIRKTYASKLIDAGVEESIIKAQMGHTRIETTMGYYYDTKDQAYKQAQIQKVIGT